MKSERHSKPAALVPLTSRGWRVVSLSSCFGLLVVPIAASSPIINLQFCCCQVFFDGTSETTSQNGPLGLGMSSIALLAGDITCMHECTCEELCASLGCFDEETLEVNASSQEESVKVAVAQLMYIAGSSVPWQVSG